MITLVLILRHSIENRSNIARNYTRCDKADCAYFVAAIRGMNSNQFEFVRQIAATKFCRGDNDFHMSHEAICCSNVAAICRIVCLGLKGDDVIRHVT